MHDFCPILLLKRDIGSADIEASLGAFGQPDIEERALLEGFTYQLDLKLAKLPYRETLKLKCLGTILRGSSGALLGPVSVALGPALQGCPVDR